jgi:chemotaxis protein methyltransferase CheR
MGAIEISDQEFTQFQRFIFDVAGISLSPSKKILVSGRLAKRLQQCQMASYGEYFRLLTSGAEPRETQTAVDLLTTNETYFFREPKHFEALRQQATAARGSGKPFRVWSAASSSGEEAYSIAMVLADCLESRPWEVVGSDLSTRVLARARAAHYPAERITNIPKSYLQRFCLRGVDDQEGTLLIDRNLRNRVQFTQVNLNTALPALGVFDIIFLRNVMIYFNGETKRQVVARVLSMLKPGGHFYIGHSESLQGINNDVRLVAPSIYLKP